MSNDSTKGGGVDEGAVEESSVRVDGHRILNAVIASNSKERPRSTTGTETHRRQILSYLINYPSEAGAVIVKGRLSIKQYRAGHFWRATASLLPFRPSPAR